MPETAAPTTPAPAATPPPAAAPPREGGMSADQAIESTVMRSRGLPKDMLERIRAKAKPTGTLPWNEPEKKAPAEVDKPEPASDQPKPEERPGGESEPEEESLGASSHGDEKPSGSPEAGADKAAGTDKKRSPWRVADHWKAKANDLERQLAEARKTAIPEAQAKDYTERLAKAEARAAELEKEIEFVNYEKSKPFQEKYHEPYAQAFKRAVAELSEIQVTDAQGATRPATAEDILALVSLPLGKAREVADATFGAFADDAMDHRKEIRALFDQRQTALEKAKTDGVEHAKQEQLKAAETQRKIGEQVQQTWKKANESVQTDKEISRFFKPVEGDEEWNTRLERGYKLSEKAFNSPSPSDPSLTPEQREEIITLHAAVNNRSASFGAMRYRIETLEKALATKDKELAQYKSSEPSQSGSSKPKAPTPSGSGYTFQTLGERLRKYAK